MDEYFENFEMNLIEYSLYKGLQVNIWAKG